MSKKVIGTTLLWVVRLAIFVCAAQLYCMWNQYLTKGTVTYVPTLSNTQII